MKRGGRLERPPLPCMPKALHRKAMARFYCAENEVRSTFTPGPMVEDSETFFT